MLFSFNLTERITGSDSETCSFKLVEANTVPQAIEHILAWLQTIHDFSGDNATYFNNALEIDDGMGLNIRVTDLKQTTKLEFIRTSLDDHTIPTEQETSKLEEISILATVMTIKTIDGTQEVYTDILATYENLNDAEVAAQAIKEGMHKDLVKERYSIDLGVLADYEELIIFQLPLNKTLLTK